MTVKFIDLFGGIGGFRHGLEQASNRFECVDYIEYDKYAVKSYNEIFGEEHEPRDVTQLSKSEISDHDLLCAGFPCQSFSIAGNRKGTDEARGKLFREIVRIAEAKEPEMLLLENVKGILSQKVVKNGESVPETKGHAFTEVLQALHELGYCLEWQVLNSKHWGVPQNRERVFIVGHLGGEPQRKVFPIGREDRGDTGENERRIKNVGNVNPSGRGMNGKVYKVDENAAMPTVSTNKGEGHKILNPLKDKTDKSWFWEQMLYSQHTDVVRALKKNSSKNQPMILNHQFRPETRPSVESEGQSGGSGLLYNSDYSYAMSSSPHYCVEPVMTPSITNKNQNMKSQVGSSDGLMFTVDGSIQHGIMEIDRIAQRYGDKQAGGVYNPNGLCPTVNYGKRGPQPHNVPETDGQQVRIRKLTPRECWRLQGFPDKAFERAEQVNSDTQLYKQAGNAVTVNVIKVLGEELIDFFDVENEISVINEVKA